MAVIINNPFGQDPLDFNDETAASRVGHRIREIRTTQGLSQAELGEAVGLSADRIQKYENGIRKPKADLLKKIADALGVSSLALADPVSSNYIGAMYAMFEMEHAFNMKIEKAPSDSSPGFCLSADFHDTMYEYMKDWHQIYTQTQTRLEAATSDEEREEIQKSYRMWQWTYPKALTDRTERACTKARIEEQIEKLQKLKDELDSMDE